MSNINKRVMLLLILTKILE